MERNQYALLGDFIPSGSSKCTLEYLRHMKMKIPKDKKSKKESTGEAGMDALVQMYPKDPILPKIMEARRVQKADMWFTDEHVGRDQRMHSTFTFDPGTGRLSSRKPNLNQIPQDRGDLIKAEVARAVRNTIIASPGFTLVEADWKAIEAVLVGYFAEDPLYIEYSKKGVHDFLGSHVLTKRGLWKEPISLEWTPERIDEAVRKFKKEEPTLRNYMKTVVHGRGYGRTVYAIAKQLKCSQKEAQEYVDIYEKMAPKVPKWQAATQYRAYKEGFLQNPYSYIRYFFDVLGPKWDPSAKGFVTDEKGNVKLYPGKEANEALAFLPQSTGAGILRETILLIDEMWGEREDRFMLIPCHDSIVFEIRDDVLFEVLSEIKKVMERPLPLLGGLTIDVEIKYGPSWREMKEWKG